MPVTPYVQLKFPRVINPDSPLNDSRQLDCVFVAKSTLSRIRTFLVFIGLRFDSGIWAKKWRVKPLLCYSDPSHDLPWFFHFRSFFFFYLKISLLEMLIAVGNDFFIFGPFLPQNFTPRDAHCWWQWASKKPLHASSHYHGSRKRLQKQNFYNCLLSEHFFAETPLAWVGWLARPECIAHPQCYFAPTHYFAPTLTTHRYQPPCFETCFFTPTHPHTQNFFEQDNILVPCPGYDGCTWWMKSAIWSAAKSAHRQCGGGWRLRDGGE